MQSLRCIPIARVILKVQPLPVKTAPWFQAIATLVCHPAVLAAPREITLVVDTEGVGAVADTRIKTDKTCKCISILLLKGRSIDHFVPLFCVC